MFHVEHHDQTGEKMKEKKEVPSGLGRDSIRGEVEGKNLLKESSTPDEVWDKLMEYAHLLHTWSGRMSLISREDRGFLISRHLVPALRWLPLIACLPKRSLLDFGSGGGLPGIPLKIALPETWVYLVESRRRRANFLREVVRRLGLKKVEVVNSRLEEWEGVEGGVDIIVSRAVMPVKSLGGVARPHLSPHGLMLIHLDEGGSRVDVNLMKVRRERWGGMAGRWGGGE
jgi:16S rRNA (guanine527-N7)-methyltransferase